MSIENLLDELVESILDQVHLAAKQKMNLLLSEKIRHRLEEKREEIRDEFYNTVPCCEECEEENIQEARPIVYWRVTSRGQKIKKFLCPKGHKRKGNTCVPQGSKEKHARRRGARKATRTRRASSSIKRAIRKRGIATRKRKMFGLTPGKRISG